MKTKLVLLCTFLFLTLSVHAQPTNFDAAKQAYLTHVYFDRLQTSYCGCNFERRGRSGGVIDLESCGVTLPEGATDFDHVRANRLEAEHVVPISRVTNKRSCGSRADCIDSDHEYNLIYSDIHNLIPSVGYINAQRSNYIFAEISDSSSAPYGQCIFNMDHENRVAEPPAQMKGKVARIYGYMMFAYGLPLSDEKQRQFIRWHRENPPTPWEIERDRRIARVMGWHNPLVTGDITWTNAVHNVAPFTGISVIDNNQMLPQIADENVLIKGNRNSNIYHLPHCPSYSRLAPQNVIEFSSEVEAKQAGFRKAGNCS